MGFKVGRVRESFLNMSRGWGGEDRKGFGIGI